MNNSFQNIEELLNSNLESHVSKQLYDNFFTAPYLYSLFPAGKLFRPKICWAISKDIFNKFSKDAARIASFSEMHHTYTLIHDDMPCMDNDDMRRGRASTHKQFGQWQALLSADGLLNASYAVLSNLDTPNLKYILKYATWALGPKGLILGQALDLSGIMNKSFDNLLLTHKLKTARLIQCCLVLPIMAKEEKLNSVDFKLLKKLHKFGEHIGVVFQLLDDLCELSDEVLSEHEAFVNPWPNNSKKCTDQIEKSFQFIFNFFESHKTKNTQEVFTNYLSKINKEIVRNSKTIESHLNINLGPVMGLFDRLNSF